MSVDPDSTRSRWRQWLPPPDLRNSSRLSLRQAVFMLFTTGLLLVCDYFLRHKIYPWLDIPVFGLSGYAPFLLGMMAVCFALFQFEVAWRHPDLTVVVAFVLGSCLAVFALRFYARVFL
jgi:hypothetical protein